MIKVELETNVWLGQKKIIQLSVCPINGMLVTITHNGQGFVSVPEFEKQMLKIYSKLQ
jgi:hypothetical protein